MPDPARAWVFGRLGVTARIAGGTWARERSLDGIQFRGAWGADVDAAWAWGVRERAGASEAALAQWNGDRWATVDWPAARGIIAIDGASSRDVWALTSDRATPLSRWNGARWSDAAGPALEAGEALFAVCSPAANNALVAAMSTVAAAARTRFFRFDGASWTLEFAQTDSVARLPAMLCPSPDEFVLVAPERVAMESGERTPARAQRVRAGVASSLTVAIAGQPVAQHTTDRRWFVRVVGARSERAPLLVWRGDALAEHSSLSPGAGAFDFASENAGYYGLDDAFAAAPWRCDQWAESASQQVFPSQLIGVRGEPPQFATGTGTLVRSASGAWSPLPITSLFAPARWQPRTNDAWVVDGDTRLAHLDGATKTDVLTTRERIVAIDGAAPDNGWLATATLGGLQRWDGRAWGALAVPLPATLTVDGAPIETANLPVLRMHAPARDRVIIAALPDLLVRFDGAQWTAERGPFASDGLLAIESDARGATWLLLGSGQLLRRQATEGAFASVSAPATVARLLFNGEAIFAHAGDQLWRWSEATQRFDAVAAIAPAAFDVRSFHLARSAVFYVDTDNSVQRVDF